MSADDTREAGAVECSWCDNVARGYASPDPGYVESSPSCGECGLNFHQDSTLFDDWLAAHVAAAVTEQTAEVEQLTAQLGAIAALVDKYAGIGGYPLSDIRAILADPAGAIAKHEHATGVWCDECPDADLKRAERVLEDHAFTDDHNRCKCGWSPTYTGIPFEHRKHLAAEVAASIAKHEQDVRADERERVAVSIETTFSDPERRRPRKSDAEFATDLVTDVEWCAQIARADAPAEGQA